jgi:modulator of FtsH protease
MGYDVEAWSDLFVACAGAAAALTGLLFVAVSINIERILALPGVPDRALQTLLVLLSVVIVSVLGLAPGQSDTALGFELAVAGLLFTGIALVLGRRVGAASAPRSRPELAARTTLVLAGTAPTIVAGVTLAAGAGGGLYWLLGGIVAAIVGGVINAWVLLVEILR